MHLIPAKTVQKVRRASGEVNLARLFKAGDGDAIKIEASRQRRLSGHHSIVADATPHKDDHVSGVETPG